MSSSEKKVPDPADNYFDTNTTLMTLGFLAIYFIIYAIMNVFFEYIQCIIKREKHIFFLS
jgi:hypothetical protein